MSNMIGDFVKNNVIALLTGAIAIGGAYTAVQVDAVNVSRDIEDLQKKIELVDPVQINKLKQFDLIIFTSMQQDIRRIAPSVDRIDPQAISAVREDLQELDEEFEAFISILSQEVKAINNDLGIDYEAIQALTRRVDDLERRIETLQRELNRQ